ncbi:tRNA pseudouridine(38-40) synthase [Plasmodium fragile]|uniref:tRNA pseudouridine synthase n=1 Tax=Plasmodium fragile TaxID=5857 RepID=A0A0D9QRJ7_PLAFR|nr:tRNA pseudouridine(38-40) synthase [Plasmodium fragile]KJP89422.1 tRNA pseudouridine(38-40) synthase [Plasmodium fragile]
MGDRADTTTSKSNKPFAVDTFPTLFRKTQGSAYQKDNPNTVENRLMDCLHALNLIPGVDQPFSRVSRTDKGVSARMNALTIRLKIRHPHMALQDIERIYVKEMNKRLKNIHVIDIRNVPNFFDARLHCIHRTYLYFFMDKNYNFERMREACKLFLGEHDFANFCKKRKNSTCFRRTILKFELRSMDKNFHYFKIKGTSFLYNQIRHMVATLFQVATGNLELEDLASMLNNHPSRDKNFKIANEDGLLLYSFKFSDLNFHINVDNRVFSHLMEKYIQSAVLLVSLCYPGKVKRQNCGLFEDIMPDGDGQGEGDEENCPP